ncbi:hypothetical protein HGRIS_011258 [Hohenbuehelia grisea]|uniref:laccase n=1 Tax=Hohenbuehelia grisea TaxID=104357 RepID=A0ABR3JVC0_9AGAR
MIINGRGRAFFTDNGLSVTKVAPGKRYRLRIINASCQSSAQLLIDGHTLTIIELDGIKVNTRVTDGIDIHPGQRISAVLHANQPIDSYWIRTKISFEGEEVDDERGFAILRYDGANSSELFPHSQKKALASIIRTEEGIVPYGVPDKVPREPDIKINLNFTIYEDNYIVNGKPFFVPSVPVLLQIMNGADPHKLMPKGSIITLPRNKLVEISLPGGAIAGPHPLHLHGHSFEVIRSINSTKYNRINPPIRDVVNTGMTGDNATIRFMTDNPGPWLLHCHMEFHYEMGLAVVFAEEPSETRKQEEASLSQEWKDLCTRWERSDRKGKKWSKSIWPGLQKSRFSFKDPAPDDE